LIAQMLLRTRDADAIQPTPRPRLQREPAYAEGPLTRALSPSEGEREKHRQIRGVVHVMDYSVKLLSE